MVFVGNINDVSKEIKNAINVYGKSARIKLIDRFIKIEKESK